MEFAAVILAAGEGRRAQGFKPLFPINKTTVVEYVMMNALSVCSEIRIVGGCQFERLSHHLRNRDDSVKLIHNKGWRQGGMFSSVQAGLKALTGPVFIHPVDFAGSGSGVYSKLAQAFAGGVYGIYRPQYSGRAGHPILISAATVRLVQQASAEKTLRQVLSPMEKREVEVDDELILCDFNTPQEYELLKKKIKAR